MNRTLTGNTQYKVNNLLIEPGQTFNDCFQLPFNCASNFIIAGAKLAFPGLEKQFPRYEQVAIGFFTSQIRVRNIAFSAPRTLAITSSKTPAIMRRFEIKEEISALF